MEIEFVLNGEPQRVDVPPHWTLLRVIRDAAGGTDVKYGCGEGVCGACAVFVDGVAMNSCSVLAPQVEGASIETVSGLAGDGKLHPLQAEMISRGAVQCGFCTPGMLTGALEAVKIGAAGSDEEIRHSLAGNLCRCTGYGKIVAAVTAYRDGEAPDDVSTEAGEHEHMPQRTAGNSPAPGVGVGH